MARAFAPRAQDDSKGRRRGPPRGRRRLRGEGQHPALAAGARLPRPRAAALRDMGGRQGCGRGRIGAVERPRRPGGARRPCGACKAGDGPGANVRHLPRPPGPRPGRGRDHVAPSLRPSRREPSCQGPRHRARPHHEPEPRVPGRRSLDPARRLLRLAAQPERRVRRGPGPPNVAGVQRPVPPRGLPRPAGQPAPLRPVPGDGAGARSPGPRRVGHEGGVAAAQGPDPRLGPDRDRPGRRVRLRRHAGLQGAARGGDRDGPRQLQPGDDHDRRRRRRPRLPRAADGRGGPRSAARPA